MSAEPCGVLFLCTGNSARSLIAEALLRDLGAPRYRSFSAGSQPKDAPHPLTLETLAARGHGTEGLASKSWSVFEGETAPRLDVVLTVCGNAAAETCPVWPGAPLAAHWGVDDPAAAEGTKAERMAVFDRIYDRLREKVEALAALDPAAMEREAFAARLRAIGALGGDGRVGEA